MKPLASAVFGVALIGAGFGISVQALQPARVRPVVPLPRTAPAAPAAMPVDVQNRLVASNCATCHDDEGKPGGLSLEHFDAATIDQHADVAEKMIHKLRAGMMPPPTATDRPAPPVLAAFAAALEDRVDRAAAHHPNPGRRIVPAAEPRRVCAGRARSARRGCRCQRVPACRHDEQRLRQYRRRAERSSPTLIQGYLRAANRDRGAGDGRPFRQPERSDLQAAAHRVADAPRRRHAVGHARRHLDRAHVPGRRRLHVPHGAALGPTRPALRQYRSRRADRSVDQRRARRAVRHPTG